MLPVAVLLLAHVLVLTARSEAFAEPVHALDCKAVFAGGKAPSNLRAPSFNATLIPLCHGKGQNVYFYTVYDSTMLHGTLTAYRISPKQVQNCKGVLFPNLITFGLPIPVVSVYASSSTR